MIRQRNCPFPYNYKPYTPEPIRSITVLAHVPDMEFALMDLEGRTLDEVEPNIIEVVARARAVNPDIRAGNYNYFPGEYNGSMPCESQADRTNDPYGADLNEIYLTSGLDIAMPSCYPYEFHECHIIPGQYGGSSPNTRSALFWAPIERLSVAKRDLPAGHMLMPGITPFVAWEGYEATPPPPADVEALTQHLRLRGADAFQRWSTGADEHPDFDARSSGSLPWPRGSRSTNTSRVRRYRSVKHRDGQDRGRRVVGHPQRRPDAILASNSVSKIPPSSLCRTSRAAGDDQVPLNEHLLLTFYTAGCPEDSHETGMRLALDQNHPNPFNPMTFIRAEIHESDGVGLPG